MRSIVIPCTLALLLLLGACQTKEQTGAVVGGVAGGVLGSQVGEGEGRTAAIIAGTLIGAVVGGQVGKYMDREDERRAQDVLEYNRTGQSSSWSNPDRGTRVTMTPTETYERRTGQPCREYQTEVIIGGETKQGYGTACRQADGSWKVINAH